MLVLKIEPSEITPFFYHNFFHFGGGDVPYVPHSLATPMHPSRYFNSKDSTNSTIQCLSFHLHLSPKEMP